MKDFRRGKCAYSRARASWSARHPILRTDGGEQRKTLFCTLMEPWGAGHCIADSMAIICMGLLFRYMAK